MKVNILHSIDFKKMSSCERLKVLLRIARLRVKISELNAKNQAKFAETIHFEDGSIFDAK